MQGAMQPLPQIAGAAGAATGCIQMTTAAVVSGLVAELYDGHSALSMTAFMACSLLALIAYLLLARPAECVVVLAWPLLAERPSRTTSAGVVLAFVGVVVLAAGPV